MIKFSTYLEHLVRKGLQNDKKIKFTGGFTKLHTKSYQRNFNANGFRIAKTTKSLNVVQPIRNAKHWELKGEYHPLA